MQQQPEETQRKLLLIVHPHTTGEKSQTYELKASCIVHWFGLQMVGHTQPSLEQNRIVPQRTANVSKSPPDGNSVEQP